MCVAHAHIDMNWMWGYDETVTVTIDTMRTMLNLFDEYKDFKFSQSQASIYKILEEHAPNILEKVKRRVKEKRFEVTATTWVETDKNMPSGESLTRHQLYTRQYLSKLLDLTDEDFFIDFEPDTFGHSRNVPEILSKGNIKFYYNCRGHEKENILYRWKSPSGAEVILYTEPHWYNGEIDASIGDYATALAEITGSKTLLKVYGVGDHGGGPTRRDIECLIDMNTWPIYPELTFNFLQDYYKAIEPLKDKFTLIEGEINFLCDGCYTSQSKIKAGNKNSERDLYNTESLSV